jgi:O-antigen ligase
VTKLGACKYWCRYKLNSKFLVLIILKGSYFIFLLSLGVYGHEGSGNKIHLFPDNFQGCCTLSAKKGIHVL